MDPKTIFDQGSAEDHPPMEAGREWPGVKKDGGRAEVRFPGEDGGKSLAEMAVRDLDGTLQLLAERAQYITQATGAAIALRDGDEMVCKASAGASAPEVGARLQMESGLSGESIRTRQILRCDDAQTDGRVNRESCEALGIASVLVMPMLDEEEQVLGVFELFSDRPHAFEERDIEALERMAFMVRTAIARAEGGPQEIASAPPPDSTEVTAGAHEAGEEDITEEFQGEEATPGPGAEQAEEEESVATPKEPAIREPVIKDEISLEMPVKKAAEVSAVEEPLEGVAPAVHNPKIAFHIRGPLPRKAAAAVLETKSAQGADQAAEQVVAESRSTAELEKEHAMEASPAGSRESSRREEIQDAPSKADLKVEAAAIGASGAAAAPALAVPEKKAAAAEMSSMPKPETVAVTPAASPKTEAPPVTLTFGTAIVPNITSGPAEAVANPPVTPSDQTANPTVEESAAPKVPAPVEAAKSTSGPTARSMERARSAVAGLRRCESCGFPVSEGRHLCLDCEKKKGAAAAPAKVEAKPERPGAPASDSAPKTPVATAETETATTSSTPSVKPDGDGPQFLVGSPDRYESWIVQHMYAAVAAAVVIIGVMVYLLSR